MPFPMGVQPATVQRILRHSSITVTTGTDVDEMEAVQRDAMDSMSTLLAHAATIRDAHCRQNCRQTALSSLPRFESSLAGLRVCELRVCELRVCKLRVCELRVCELRGLEPLADQAK